MWTGVTLAAHVHTRCQYDKSELIFREISIFVNHIMIAVLSRQYGVRTNEGPCKNQIDNKKEQRADNARERNGCAVTRSGRQPGPLIGRKPKLGASAGRKRIDENLR